MKKLKRKEVRKNLTKIGTTLTLLLMQSNICLATGIGTAEVQTATENIKRVITSIAMPLRWNLNICKCSNCSIKNDSKF